MSIDKNGRYCIGPVSYILPNDIEHIEDFESNAVYCFLMEKREYDFQLNMEACYSREDAKTYLHAALDDEEIEPLGEVTPFALNDLSGCYLDYFLPQYQNVRREFCFDLPDEEYNFLSVIITAQNEKKLQYALRCEMTSHFLENIRFET